MLLWDIAKGKFRIQSGPERHIVALIVSIRIRVSVWQYLIPIMRNVSLVLCDATSPLLTLRGVQRDSLMARGVSSRLQRRNTTASEGI